ncbi:MAG TPA: 1,4-beta-xylanase [Verrucomicrobiota bacterium]|nr:1,4-beta-xylanase [Verrucomicrobiota bacterium]HNU50438.1 1,4-beta-xylanase [Verrucomicrobiota bacterium]
MQRHRLLSLIASILLAVTAIAASRWTPEQAQAWSRKTGWLVGCNFSPSTAINQLELWQADTFDPATIDRELGWARQLGFNSIRVFLHHLAWKQDPPGFLKRMDQFLGIAARHNIGVMFVFFDSCWDPLPRPGPQRAPRPHVHNSGWIQDPGRELLTQPDRLDELKPYVLAVLNRFRADPRIHVWDLFNEPDNDNRNSYGANGAKTEVPNKPELTLPLLKKVFAWARQTTLSQPVTAGVWIGTWADPARLSPFEQVMLENSDVISFHNYSKADDLRRCIENLRRYQRPILCTEYMARPAGSTFDPTLGLMKEQGVGAYNWGFVSGKTQTIYPWDSWQKTYTAEPPVWFHDILRPDGTPYIPTEADYIKRITAPAP